MNDIININSDKEIDISRILRMILMHSKILIAITFLGFSIGLAQYLSSPKTYKIASLLETYSNTGSASSQNPSDMLFNISSSSTDVVLLSNLYKTRSNLLDIINKFNLNVYIDNDDIVIESIELLIDNNELSRNFFIEIKNDKYNLLDTDKNFILQGEFDRRYEANDIIVNIKKPLTNIDKLVEVKYFNPSVIAKSFASEINIETIKSESFTSQNGLIKVSYITSDIEEGINIVNHANNLLLSNSIKFESQKAQKAIDFIDKQLVLIEEMLILKKQNLKNFKELNESVNVDMEIQIIVDSLAEVEDSINRADLEYAEALELYTKSNPIIKNISTKKELLLVQKSSIEDKIKKLPVAEQNFIDLYRDVEVTQEIFIDLSNRKLGYSIMEASTLGNIRVIDDAFLDYKTGPRSLFVVLSTLFFFVFGIIVTLIRGFYFTPLTNPAEIADAGINNKIFGVIPFIDEDNRDDITFNRSIESLIMNLQSVDGLSKGSKSITFTSPTQDNGKSTISRSVAQKLGDMGHKTLLIDCDLIRGDQHKFNLIKREKIGKDTFINITNENIDQYFVNENFYFIPKIKKVDDSFNFLYNDSYFKKIDFLKTIFDFIIIDTAPVLSVSDTSILMTYSDYNFLLARHGITRINEVKQSIFMSEQIGKVFDGIVYNGYSKPKSYYGYYGLYGDYKYEYYAKKYLYQNDYKADDNE